MGMQLVAKQEAHVPSSWVFNPHCPMPPLLTGATERLTRTLIDMANKITRNNFLLSIVYSFNSFRRPRNSTFHSQVCNVHWNISFRHFSSVEIEHDRKLFTTFIPSRVLRPYNQRFFLMQTTMPVLNLKKIHFTWHENILSKMYWFRASSFNNW